MEMNFHLCCNQLEHQWEVRHKSELVIFKGSLDECKQIMSAIEAHKKNV